MHRTPLIDSIRGRRSAGIGGIGFGCRVINADLREVEHHRTPRRTREYCAEKGGHVVEMAEVVRRDIFGGDIHKIDGAGALMVFCN